MGNPFSKAFLAFDSFIRRHLTAILLSVINTVVLLFGTYLLNNLTRFTGEDIEQYALVEWVKDKLGMSGEPGELPLYVNVAYDKQLVDVYDDDSLLLGNRDITDRSKLLGLLRQLAETNDYRYIFLDVRFERGYASENDSALFRQIREMPRMVVVRHEDMEMQDSSIIGKTGLNEYYSTITSTNFVRYPYLIGDSATIPLMAYRSIDGGDITRYLGCVYTDQGRLCHRSLFLHFPIREYTEYDDDGEKIYYNLGADSLFVPAGYVTELARDKVVVIGNMVDDVHDTHIGLQPGPVITYLAYDALTKGEHLVKPWLVIVLALLFFCVSLSLFSHLSLFDRLPLFRSVHSHTLRFLMSFIGYTFVLTVFSILLCFFFNVAISTLCPSLYFALQKVIIHYRRIRP